MPCDCAVGSRIKRPNRDDTAWISSCTRSAAILALAHVNHAASSGLRLKLVLGDSTSGMTCLPPPHSSPNFNVNALVLEGRHVTSTLAAQPLREHKYRKWQGRPPAACCSTAPSLQQGFIISGLHVGCDNSRLQTQPGFFWLASGALGFATDI